MPETLATELEVYEGLLPELSDRAGKYAVVHGKELVGVYDTYADALASGYDRCGLEQFLVKQISTIPNVGFFSRDLVDSCLT